MNVTPVAAAISLESREALEVLFHENVPLEARMHLDQNQQVHCVHCLRLFILGFEAAPLFCEIKAIFPYIF